MARQSNLYKYKIVEHQQNPPSCGGNWECGTYTRVCISTSPKKALAMEEGTYTRKFEGVDGVPVLQEHTFTKGNKVIFNKWD